MPRGRPKSLSNYEKLKAKKIRSFLSENNISRFDKMNNATLLNIIHVSEDQIYVSLDYHDETLNKISEYVAGRKF